MTPLAVISSTIGALPLQWVKESVLRAITASLPFHSRTVKVRLNDSRTGEKPPHYVEHRLGIRDGTKVTRTEWGEIKSARDVQLAATRRLHKAYMELREAKPWLASPGLDSWDQAEGNLLRAMLDLASERLPHNQTRYLTFWQMQASIKAHWLVFDLNDEALVLAIVQRAVDTDRACDQVKEKLNTYLRDKVRPADLMRGLKMAACGVQGAQANGPVPSFGELVQDGRLPLQDFDRMPFADASTWLENNHTTLITLPDGEIFHQKTLDRKTWTYGDGTTVEKLCDYRNCGPGHFPFEPDIAQDGDH